MHISFHCSALTMTALLIYVKDLQGLTEPVCTALKCKDFCSRVYNCNLGTCSKLEKCSCDECPYCESDEQCTKICQTKKKFEYGKCTLGSWTAKCICIRSCIDNTYCSIKCRWHLKCQNGFCVKGKCECLSCNRI